MTRLLISVLAAAAALATAAVAPRDKPPATSTQTQLSSPAAVVVDTRRADYYEDEGTGRVLADVRASMLREPDGRTLLRMDIAAEGPLVQPIPGFAGVHGANRDTAREILEIIEDERWEVVITDERGQERRGGRFVVTREGTLPERRIRPDGTLDVDGRTDLVLPLEARVVTPPLARGRHRVELFVDHEPRLFAIVRVFRHGARILELGSLASVRHATPRRRLRVQEVPSPLIANSDWAQRDLEGRWVFYTRSVREDAKRQDPWIKLLAKEKEWDLLELISVYEGNRAAADALMRAKAPQWRRNQLWHLVGISTHGLGGAKTTLQEVEPGLTLAWLRLHRERLPMAGRQLLLEMEKAGTVATGDAGPLSAPFDREEVFRHLSPPDVVLHIGAAARTRPGRTYVHQVERALTGLTRTTNRPEDHIERVTRLSSHPVPEVRRAALLAWASLDRTRMPLDRIVVQAADAVEPKEVREAAVMAISYSQTPGAWLALHLVAEDPEHPGWRAALSRLGTVGNAFSRRHVGRTALTTRPQLRDDPFVKTQIGRMTSVMFTLELQAQRGRPKEKVTRAEVVRHLRRVVAAQTGGLSFAVRLHQWTVRSVAERIDLPFIRDEIEALASGKSSASPPSDDAHARLKALAAEVLQEASR